MFGLHSTKKDSHWPGLHESQIDRFDFILFFKGTLTPYESSNAEI